MPGFTRTSRSIGSVGLAMIALVIAPASLHAQSTNPAPAKTDGALVAPESLEDGFILIVQDNAKLATASTPIYLASNHVNWNPSHPSMKLEPRSDMRWQIILPKPKDAAPLEFKFTRGSWDETEVNADLSDKGNRRLEKIDASKLKPGEKPIIELTVERWSDQRPSSKRAMDSYHALEVTGTVKRLQIVGGGGKARSFSRDALVWLPPGYDAAENRETRYPVLYLLDGQNVFEQPPGVPGEWHADETAMELVKEMRINPIIIVAIPHAAQVRTSEYLPVAALEGIEPGGEEFVSFLVERVMPRVERSFRVSTEAKDTVIGGASMGAVISACAVSRHPERFGGVMLESMPTFSTSAEWASFLDGIQRWPAKVSIGMGSQETGSAPEARQANETYVASARKLEQRIKGASGSSTNVRVVIGDGQQHQEQAWAKRLPENLLYFFGVQH